MQQKREFPVAAPGQQVLWWIWVPNLVAAVAYGYAVMQPARTPMTAVSWATLPFLLLVGLGLTWAVRRRQIVLDNRTLQVKAALYTRSLQIDAIDLAHARVVSLEEHTDLKPAFKTNGLALPGLKAGHFRMRNLTRAFCLLTDRTRVLALPLKDGSTLLLSPVKPADLLAHLRELATPAARR